MMWSIVTYRSAFRSWLVVVSLAVAFGALSGCTPKSASVKRESGSIRDTVKSGGVPGGSGSDSGSGQSAASSSAPVPASDSSAGPVEKPLPAHVTYETVLLDPIDFAILLENFRKNSDIDKLLLMLPDRTMADWHDTRVASVDLRGLKSDLDPSFLDGASHVKLFLEVELDQALPALPDKPVVASSVTVGAGTDWTISLEAAESPAVASSTANAMVPAENTKQFDLILDHLARTQGAAIGIYAPGSGI